MYSLKEIIKIKKMKGFSWDKLAENLPISGNALRIAFTRKSVDDVYLEKIYEILQIENNVQSTHDTDKKISERIERIKQMMQENNITAYEVHQNTSISTNGVQKIIDGLSENPRERTLEEIETFLNARINNEFTDDKISIGQLRENVIKYWDELQEDRKFKDFYYLQMARTLNLDFEEIIKNALSGRKQS